jgi:hypothetical protein
MMRMMMMMMMMMIIIIIIIICNNLISRVWGRIEVCTGCWWGSLRESGHWGDQDVDGRIILKWIFRKLGGDRGD